MKIFFKIIGYVILFFPLFLINYSTPTALAGNPPDPNNSSIYVDQVPADGQTTANITVILQDNSGNPLTQDTISLSISNNVSVSPASATLDESGAVSFNATSGSPGTYNIDVKDITLGRTLSNFGQITFDPVEQFESDNTVSPTGTSSCKDEAPGSTPDLISADVVGPTQVKLTWNSASDPVSSYLVSYGLESANYIYGNIYIGGHDATSYTVSKLRAGITYYFAIKAVNGCAPSDYSNEISADVVGVNSQLTISPTQDSQVASTTGVQNTIKNTKLNISTFPSVAPTTTQSKPQNLSFTFIIFVVICIFLLICIVVSFIFYLKSRNKDTYLPQIQPVNQQELPSAHQAKEELIESIKQKLE